MKSEAGPGPGQWLSAQSVGDCRVQAVQAPESLPVNKKTLCVYGELRHEDEEHLPFLFVDRG